MEIKDRSLIRIIYPPNQDRNMLGVYLREESQHSIAFMSVETAGIHYIVYKWQAQLTRALFLKEEESFME